jgi:hypothetical protein
LCSRRQFQPPSFPSRSCVQFLASSSPVPPNNSVNADLRATRSARYCQR